MFEEKMVESFAVIVVVAFNTGRAGSVGVIAFQYFNSHCNEQFRDYSGFRALDSDMAECSGDRKIQHEFFPRSHMLTT